MIAMAEIASWITPTMRRTEQTRVSCYFSRIFITLVALLLPVTMAPVAAAVASATAALCSAALGWLWGTDEVWGD